MLVGKTSLLDPYVNSWSRDSIYLSDNSYLTEAEPTDIQPVLEALTDGEWNCSTGDVSQLAQLRKWFTANSVESQWSEKILEFLQENCTPSTISEGSKSSQFLVDIQLIDVLGRVNRVMKGFMSLTQYLMLELLRIRLRGSSQNRREWHGH